LKSLFLFTVLFFCGLQIAHAQDPNDCINALTVCGNANLAFNSSGRGNDDFSHPGNQGPSCIIEEVESLWIRVPIQSSGTLGFTISANNTNDDYDFAVYGPDLTCTTLGSPIRCSFAGLVNNGVTGTLESEAETTDNDGDGWVSILNVIAGQTYFMLIDNFSDSNNGFDLVWTGSAVIAGEPSINTPVVPSICDNNNDDEEPFNLSSLDKDINGGNSNINLTYHRNQDEATLGQNALLKDHMAKNGEEIFARGTFVANGCAATTSFTFQLEAEPSMVSVTGPRSVCPDVNGVVYEAQGDPDYTYEWFISGGTISGPATDNQIEVAWGTTNDSAFLKVLPTASSGCVGDTVNVDITINRRLEPALPSGPNEICLNANTEAIYSIANTPGSQYDWTVENGIVLSGNGTSEVLVRWDGTTTGSIFFVESNPAITDCEGTSPTLSVTQLPVITDSPVLNHVTCFGTSTASISVNPAGGEGVLNVTWADGATGTDRTSLPSGDYTYTITDDNGCQLINTVTITQPDDLVIDNNTQGNLLCFQDNSGFIEISPIGGTTPYRYQWTINANNLNANSARINNLASGTYTVLVTDANGCTTNGSYILTEPTLLEPDLDQLINLPICPQSSDGEVTVGAKGGTPDYEFVWQLNPVQNGVTATGLPRGNYTVNITDANGCSSSQQVEVVERFPRVYIPNAFSPNGDVENDAFHAISQCPLSSFSMSVFNKWGNLVFRSTDINSGWNGFLEGKEVPLGSYAYQVSYTFNVNGQLIAETIHGRIKVIR